MVFRPFEDPIPEDSFEGAQPVNVDELLNDPIDLITGEFGLEGPSSN